MRPTQVGAFLEEFPSRYFELHHSNTPKRPVLVPRVSKKITFSTIVDGVPQMLTSTIDLHLL